MTIVDTYGLDDTDPESKIWRYRSLPQLLSILHEEALRFTSCRDFDDPYEASRPEPFRFGSGERFSQFGRAVSSQFYLNCWHLNEDQSVAMWDIYSEKGKGVAIQTTLDRIIRTFETIDEGFMIGSVQYVDFDDSSIPSLYDYGPFPPLFHKRMSFRHENEVRILAQRPQLLENDVIGVPSVDDFQSGFYQDIDLDALIERIYISPSAPNWLEEPIQSLIERFGLDIPVVKSNLYDEDRPIY